MLDFDAESDDMPRFRAALWNLVGRGIDLTEFAVWQTGSYLPQGQGTCQAACCQL